MFIASVSILAGLAFMGLTAAILSLLSARSGRAAASFLREGISRLFLIPRRRSLLSRQLPGALVNLASSVRAGLSLPQAIRAAGGSLDSPLGPCFLQMDEELSRGATLDQALSGFERRVPLPEARMMAAGLRIARLSGGGLAPLLEHYAGAMRERERLKGRIRSLTAQGRLSGWVVGSVPLVLLLGIWAIDPSFIRPLLVTPAGWGLLSLAGALELLGALAIRAIVRIEA